MAVLPPNLTAEAHTVAVLGTHGCLSCEILMKNLGTSQHLNILDILLLQQRHLLIEGIVCLVVFNKTLVKQYYIPISFTWTQNLQFYC